MSNYRQRLDTTAGLPWERAAYLRALIESGAVQVAPDERRMHRLPGGLSSMLRVNHATLLTRPDPARQFIGAMTAFVERGFDDHIVLAAVPTGHGAHLTGAVAHVLGVRQALVPLSTGGSVPRPQLPGNLGASPASAFIILADVLTPGDTALLATVRSLRESMRAQKIRTGLFVLGGVVRDYTGVQRQLAEYGAAVHYLLSLRTVAGDPRLRISQSQRRLLRQEFE